MSDEDIRAEDLAIQWPPKRFIPIPPGTQAGWGASWWFKEQGLNPYFMSPSERVAAMCRYFEAVAEGWAPPVPRDQWVGPHDPVEPAE